MNTSQDNVLPAMTEHAAEDGTRSSDPSGAPHALTVEGIIAIHAEAVAQGGGSDSRIISEANLHQLVFCANTLPDPCVRAAYVLYLLCAYPPFREGNEETARRIVAIILREGGLHMALDTGWIAPLIAGIAAYSVEPGEIEQAIREHARKSPETL